MALIWASLISQVPVEPPVPNADDPFLDFDGGRFLSRRFESFLSILGAGLLGFVAVMFVLQSLPSINSGYEWPLHIYTVQHTHTRARSRSQRQKHEWLRPLGLVITPRHFLKDHVWNTLESNQRRSQQEQKQHTFLKNQSPTDISVHIYPLLHILYVINKKTKQKKVLRRICQYYFPAKVTVSEHFCHLGQ